MKNALPRFYHVWLIPDDGAAQRVELIHAMSRPDALACGLDFARRTFPDAACEVAVIDPKTREKVDGDRIEF